MPKILIHGNEARQALARGVKRLAAAVEPTLGPKGMNAMVDRPIGTPLITRDGVSIASEIELFDRFENMGAQVVREVSMQTNEVAGDGTTTSIVLANGIVQGGVELTSRGAKAVDLCHGIDLAVRDGARRAARERDPGRGRRCSTVGRQHRRERPQARRAGRRRLPRRRGQGRHHRPTSPSASTAMSTWSRACPSTAATSRTISSPTRRRCAPTS